MRKQKLDEVQDYMNPERLQEALQRLLQQISNRDQKILWVKGEVQRLMDEKAEIRATMLQTQTQLKEREAQLNEILTSRTWKIALFIQRIRTFLVPLQSRRARVLQRGIDILSSPFKKIGRK